MRLLTLSLMLFSFSSIADIQKTISIYENGFASIHEKQKNDKNIVHLPSYADHETLSVLIPYTKLSLRNAPATPSYFAIKKTNPNDVLHYEYKTKALSYRAQYRVTLLEKDEAVLASTFKIKNTSKDNIEANINLMIGDTKRETNASPPALYKSRSLESTQMEDSTSINNSKKLSVSSETTKLSIGTQFIDKESIVFIPYIQSKKVNINHVYGISIGYGQTPFYGTKSITLSDIQIKDTLPSGLWSIYSENGNFLGEQSHSQFYGENQINLNMGKGTNVFVSKHAMSLLSVVDEHLKFYDTTIVNKNDYPVTVKLKQHTILTEKEYNDFLRKLKTERIPLNKKDSKLKLLRKFAKNEIVITLKAKENKTITLIDIM